MEQLALPYYGVQIAAKILEIPAPQISFISQSQLPIPTITAMYLQETKEIIFNEDWVLQANWLEVIATSFHECRHAYQHYCLSTSSRENKATRDTWSSELSSYFQPNADKPQASDVDYLQQSIEVDAIAFTHLHMKNLFNTETNIPKMILSKVGHRVIQIERSLGCFQ
jgi:hypothetical protein